MRRKYKEFLLNMENENNNQLYLRSKELFKDDHLMLIYNLLSSGFILGTDISCNGTELISVRYESKITEQKKYLGFFLLKEKK